MRKRTILAQRSYRVMMARGDDDNGGDGGGGNGGSDG